MTKENILREIEILFFSKTFKEVSMQDIANKLSIKKASLYYYFPSKEVLINEVLDYSFGKYLEFINYLIKKWDENNFQKLLKEFINFGEKNKNLFSIINQNGFRENDDFLKHSKEKQKIIFDLIFEKMQEKAHFSKEKTFLFLNLINNFSNKKSIFSMCKLNQENILKEIENLFFN